MARLDNLPIMPVAAAMRALADRPRDDTEWCLIALDLMRTFRDACWSDAFGGGPATPAAQNYLEDFRSCQSIAGVAAVFAARAPAGADAAARRELNGVTRAFERALAPVLEKIVVSDAMRAAVLRHDAVACPIAVLKAFADVVRSHGPLAVPIWAAMPGLLGRS